MRETAILLGIVAVLTAGGRGAVATVGTTLYSTTEAIATAVKDGMKEPDAGPAEDVGKRPDDGGR